jgi:ribosome-associated protein
VKRAPDIAAPSRTELKNASEQLQKIGEALLTLHADAFAVLALPAQLQEAIFEAKRLTSFGAKRRQLQFIGKLMRGLPPETLETVGAVLRVEHGQSAQDVSILHRAEKWRDSLIAADDGFGEWIARFPGTDAQRLRALIRQARKEALEPKPGEARRRGKAYREIFTLVRSQLSSSGGSPL